jgi:hypothetical protein
MAGEALANAIYKIASAGEPLEGALELAIGEGTNSRS